MSDIWYMLRDAQRYVYHYTRSSILAEFILPDQRLRLSPFHALNDPREAKCFDINGAAWGDDLHPTVLDEFAAQLKQHWRIVCFSSDPPDAVFESNDLLGASQLQAMHERGHSRPRMWAQYAENHSGACLVLDKRALTCAFAALGSSLGLSVLSGPVAYQDMPTVSNFAVGPFTAHMDEVRRHGIEIAARRHALRFWRELFLTKNGDWAAEREFRWLIYGKHDSEIYVDVTRCMKGILLGPDFPTQQLPEVRYEARKASIEVARMDWKNGIPQIRLMPPLSHVGWGSV